MPPKKGRAGGGAAAGPKAHQLAEEMPVGELLNDLNKGKWRLGPKLGQGGFGLIYLAFNAEGKASAEATHVIKQEPAGNGPLALECLFYAGTMKAAKLDAWAKSKRISDLGLPKYVGWGMHSFKSKSNRFLVMDRFGADLQRLFIERGTFSRVCVAQMALRLIDSLHYLHDSRYVHADIKAANVLLPYSKAAKQPPVKTVYLVDFGLTAKFADSDGTHKPYKQDPKRAHDGTIEFTSRDAHMGVAPSRRGDMEILGYCLVQWLCGRLPWEDKLADKNYVADQKCKFMKDIPGFMKRCFTAGAATTTTKAKGGSKTASAEGVPAEIQRYLQLVDELEYTEEPDYNQFKECFKSFLRSQGIASEAPIDFGAVTAATPKRGGSAAAKSTPKSSRASKNANVSRDLDEDDDEEIDASLSLAFPPKKMASKAASASARKKAAELKKVVEEEEEETQELAVVKKGGRKAAVAKAASSSAASSASSSAASLASSSSSRSRKRNKTEEDEDEEEVVVGETRPLKERVMNSPAKKKPRVIKVKKNVKTTDSKTQTTPRSMKTKR